MAAVEKLVFAHGPILSGKLVCLLWYQQPTTNNQQQQHGTPPRTRARSVTLMLVLVLRTRRARSWVSHQSEHNRFQTSGWFQNLASRWASFPWLLSKTCWRYFDIASFSTVEGTFAYDSHYRSFVNIRAHFRCDWRRPSWLGGDAGQGVPQGCMQLSCLRQHACRLVGLLGKTKVELALFWLTLVVNANDMFFHRVFKFVIRTKKMPFSRRTLWTLEISLQAALVVQSGMKSISPLWDLTTFRWDADIWIDSMHNLVLNMTPGRPSAASHFSNRLLRTSVSLFVRYTLLPFMRREVLAPREIYHAARQGWAESLLLYHIPTHNHRLIWRALWSHSASVKDTIHFFHSQWALTFFFFSFRTTKSSSARKVTENTKNFTIGGKKFMPGMILKDGDAGPATSRKWLTHLCFVFIVLSSST